jgi:hypothetical protein
LLSPFLLREFLAWLDNNLVGASSAPLWRGWFLAAMLAVVNLAYAFVHHLLFWAGMRTGFRMRQQAIAAVHAKARVSWHGTQGLRHALSSIAASSRLPQG